jgi:hypothetical protein
MFQIISGFAQRLVPIIAQYQRGYELSNLGISCYIYKKSPDYPAVSEKSSRFFNWHKTEI